MTSLRPLAGAVLLMLALSPAAALAAPVDIITPGGSGNASFAPPAESDGGGDARFKGESVPQADPGTGGGGSDSSSSDSYSPVEMDTRPTLQTRHFGGQANLSCQVAASARDLVVVNNSPEPLPPGTRIKWQLKKQGKRGFFAIIGELGGGKSLVADNVLDGKARPDDICIARVI